MINKHNIEELKNEITRWASVKTPTLYQHFSTILGIPTKEVKEIFLASQDIQDHIEYYFQEERKLETIERNAKFEHDQSFLLEYISEAVRNGKLVTTEKIAKEHGVHRCNMRAFAHAHPELWEQATAIKSQQERARLKAERKAVLQAEHAENRRLKAERRANFEALAQARKDEKAAKAAYKVLLAERKKQLVEMERNAREAKEAQLAENRRLKAERRAELEALAQARKDEKAAKAAYKLLLAERKKQLIEIERNARKAKEANRLECSKSQKFGSYVGSELRYEKGRLVKKLQFYISNIDLAKIGFTGHVNFFFGDDNFCGMYVQHSADHIGTFPTRSNTDYHKFELTWNKRLCDEPAENIRAPLHFHVVETPHNSGFYFKIPERFFLGYIPD